MIRQVTKLPGHILRVLVEGVCRGRLYRFTQENSYIMTELSCEKDDMTGVTEAELEAMTRTVRETSAAYYTSIQDQIYRQQTPPVFWRRFLFTSFSFLLGAQKSVAVHNAGFALAFHGLTILPGMVIHFDLSREKAIEAVEQAMLADQRLLIVTQKEPAVEDPRGISPSI